MGQAFDASYELDDRYTRTSGRVHLSGLQALVGDDPGARSSSITHQSEHALIHCGIPLHAFRLRAGTGGAR